MGNDSRTFRVSQTDCIFCKIVQGEIPARIISETANAMAFMDAFPLAKGHSLVIPKRHCERIQDVQDDEGYELFDMVKRVTRRVDSLTGATLLAIHNGRESGQEVPHVHIHLVPRSRDDGAGPVHSMFRGRVQVSNDEIFSTYEILRE